MHIEFAALLRCPAPHAGAAPFDTPLVLAADRSAARVVFDGVLGCPICGREYVVQRGVAYFGDNDGHAARAAADAPLAAAPPDDAMRVAALLGVTEPSRVVALIGGSVALARAVQDIVPVRCVVIDAVDEDRANDPRHIDDAPLAVLRLPVADARLPVAPQALAGVYFARADVPAAHIAAVLPSLRRSGRVVAPATIDVPAGLRELVRDASHWVAEREAMPETAMETATAPGSLTQLRRRR